MIGTQPPDVVAEPGVNEGCAVSRLSPTRISTTRHDKILSRPPNSHEDIARRLRPHPPLRRWGHHLAGPASAHSQSWVPRLTGPKGRTQRQGASEVLTQPFNSSLLVEAGPGHAVRRALSALPSSSWVTFPVNRYMFATAPGPRAPGSAADRARARCTKPSVTRPPKRAQAQEPPCASPHARAWLGPQSAG